jgi:predicted amidohydrolase YtcJ
LLKNYEVSERTDLKGAFVYPGFIDAHSHFYGLGTFNYSVSLFDISSTEELVKKCKEFYKQNPKPYLIGRGWDQNKFSNKQYPDNEALSKAFPDIPVLLKRVDGHAALANAKAIELANLNIQSKIDGGELLSKDGKLTGILIDNAVEYVERIMPSFTLNEKIQALKEAQKICFQNGLSSLCDAGLEPETILLIDSLQKSGTLDIRVYAMIAANDKNVSEWVNKSPIKTDKLNASSFKMYCDGALGSRGAMLKKPYSDAHNHFGLFVTNANKAEEYISKIIKSNYQLNTHCIGDSANKLILDLYSKYLQPNNDRRWRIEHAQVLDAPDFEKFAKYKIIPSVQPTHATSDMYWAEDRLGKERIKYAYAYKQLLDQNHWMPLGTDFPVEYVNPMYTFYAAVSRQDAKGFPINGFEPKNALSREEALKGMTIWAAKAAFEENEKGGIEPGKFADFTILSLDLMHAPLLEIRNTKVLATYVAGKKKL